MLKTTMEDEKEFDDGNKVVKSLQDRKEKMNLVLKLPKFIQAQWILIKKSKKLQDYTFPEEGVNRVNDIIHSMEVRIVYGRTFRKELKKIREEINCLESQILLVIRQIITDKNPDVRHLCIHGLDLLNEIKKIYQSLNSRVPQFPALSLEHGPEDVLNSLDFLEHETIRFVGFACVFSYLKTNKFLSIHKAASFLGLNAPFRGRRNARQAPAKRQRMYQLQRKVEADCRQVFPYDVDQFDEYMALARDLKTKKKDMEEDEVDFSTLKVGNPAFAINRVVRNSSGKSLRSHYLKSSTYPTINCKMDTGNNIIVTSEDAKTLSLRNIPIRPQMMLTEYLMGVLQMAFQLSELAITAAIRDQGGQNMPDRLAKFLMTLHRRYSELDHVNAGPLRRTYDKLKYSVRETRNVAEAILLKRSLEVNPTNFFRINSIFAPFAEGVGTAYSRASDIH